MAKEYRKQYRVVMATTTAGLADLVDELLAQGWFLQGGVALAAEDGNDILAQALTKGRSPD